MTSAAARTKVHADALVIRLSRPSAGPLGFTPGLSSANLWTLVGLGKEALAMSLFSRLFGGKDLPRSSEPVVYNGFTIIPEPISEGSRYRVAAQIEKAVDGEKRAHRMIRADVLEDRDSAVEVSTAKAKQMIDEQGEQLLG